jgi:hypothetical protein
LPALWRQPRAGIRRAAELRRSGAASHLPLRPVANHEITTSWPWPGSARQAAGVAATPSLTGSSECVIRPH